MTDEARAILERLPELLRETPQLRYQLYELLSETFARHDDVVRILGELKASREDSNRRFDEAARRDQDTRDWVGITVGHFQTRAGRSLEDAIAGTLRVALRRPDLEPETLRLRQKLTDTEGRIGPPGRTYEYDIMVADGENLVFEVKSVPDTEDVDRFADKCELVRHALALHRLHAVLVTLAKTPELVERCEQRKVELA
ncbi:MAG: hypothetical protein HY722_03080 [Planctomycetes bacterium]|nr:hypothetical protein [Planctomycetota bacterium]